MLFTVALWEAEAGDSSLIKRGEGNLWLCEICDHHIEDLTQFQRHTEALHAHIHVQSNAAGLCTARK